jgi:hypothetical protein
MAAQNSLTKLKKSVSVKRNRSSTDQNFSIVPSSPDFSFKSNSMELEGLQNPNLLEQSDFHKMENKDLLLQDKFSELSDPIFDFDEAPPIVNNLATADENRQIVNKSNNIQKRIRKTNIALKKGVTRYE